MQTVTLKQYAWVKEVSIALIGSLLFALLAQVRIPLPFTPVPLTLQTLGVFLLGGLLGPRRAVFSLVAYLIEGSCGLPVFTGGAIKPLWFLGPHAGYLWAFPLAAYAVGKLTENKKRLYHFLIALCIGEIIILGGGTCWLALSAGWEKAFLIGAAPFFIGAALKICAGSLLLKSHALLRK